MGFGIAATAALTVVLAFSLTQGRSANSEALSVVVQTDQGWKTIRPMYYHKAQGTRLLPMSWFLALEQKSSTVNTVKRFANPEFLALFGFLPDDAHPDNPEGLPVGFARTKIPTLPDYLGFNCAFCHTGQITYTDPNTYRRYPLRIDGGPSMQFNARFLKELLEALKFTMEDESRRTRFVASVTQADPFYRAQEPAALIEDVRKLLSLFNDRTRLDPLEWGFGRFDALGNGGNQIFSMMYKNPDNLRVANGPVSIPSIWGTTFYDRMQWNGAARNFLARGIAEAWSAGAIPSQLDLSELQWMEEAVAKIPAPSWPDFFPPIDHMKAAEGQRLYQKKCERCHSESGDVPHFVSLADIGTDQVAAVNFANRKVHTGGATPQPAAQAMEQLTRDAIARAISDGVIRDAGRNENTWSHEPGYMARPLDAVWASPPYLHNGSVPNLYQLLSPVTERSKCFYVDNREYDPVRVGFALRRCDFQSRIDDPTTGFELDTARLGNYNIGHEFVGTSPRGNDADCRKPGILGCLLPDHERWQIVEYLKSRSSKAVSMR
jgi:hypothetical protein